jgi:hypothetical protein
VNNLTAFWLDDKNEMGEVKNMNSGEKNVLRETTFREQILTLLEVERQLENRWVVQKFQFDEWRGINVNAIIADDPISERFPITGTPTYETSGEALAAMQKLQRDTRTFRWKSRPHWKTSSMRSWLRGQATSGQGLDNIQNGGKCCGFCLSWFSRVQSLMSSRSATPWLNRAIRKNV